MGPTMLDRRRLILRTGQLALASSLAAWPVLAKPGFKDDPFTLGVAAGDPWPDGFVIWTRLVPKPLEIGGGMTPTTVKVLWEVAEDERFARIVRSGEALARPELGHSLHVEVGGLQPRRPYWYRFRIPGAMASPAGLARTAPAAGTLPERVRLGVAGCQKYEMGYYTAYRHLSRESDLDAVFHYGDYIYETAEGTVTAHKPRTVAGHEPYTLDDYRRRYAQYKTDPDLQAAHHAAAFVMTFDDHEVQNNWASQWDENGTPPELFALRKLGAMQAWYEHMPVRKAQFPLNGLEKTMYRRLDYGRLMRMHVLDTRTFRDIQLCDAESRNACRKTNGPEATILGREQEAWLAGGLTGERGWNLIAQQVMVMTYDLRQKPEAPFGVRVDDWNGYPAARARLVEAITERRLTNVVIATGDAHQHFVGTVPVRDQDPGGPSAATEFLATSVASAGDGGLVKPGFERALEFNPNLKLVNNQRGYMTFDITPKTLRCDLQVLDKVSVRDGRLSKLASFVVTPDQPVPHKA